MKATGIVRRIDDLGRVVIPKELRRTMRIKGGDPLEIFVGNDGCITLRKYSPFKNLDGFAQEYTYSLHKTTGHIACITKDECIVASSGAFGRDLYLINGFSSNVKRALKEKISILVNDGSCTMAAAPIIVNEEPVGVVSLIARDSNTKLGDLELKLVETAATFLACYMEEG
jgi:AbrB family transcriptional regulator (stage V sporulation protein T)